MNEKINYIIVKVFQIIFLVLMAACTEPSGKSEKAWPPALPTADANGVASLETEAFLKIPPKVFEFLETDPDATLSVARSSPKIHLVYHDGLEDAALNGTGWSSWGDLCVASDGTVYSGTGNHGGLDKGESYVYRWDPSARTLRKIADLNAIAGVKPEEVHFSKVHAHIIEGKNGKIYFTGTLNDGGLAGSEAMKEKWTSTIAGGKLFQYDPLADETIVYANLPEARVTATMAYDKERNYLYCSLEGDPKGFSLGVFDLDRKEWIYTGPPGEISGQDRNFMLDSRGNIYFNGKEHFEHTGIRLEAQLREWQLDKQRMEEEGSLIPQSMLPGIKRRINKHAKTYTTLWKYDPNINKVVPTNSYFTSLGFRSATRESKEGYIYGSTMGGELFRYSPEEDLITLLGSNFMKEGEYITVCDLSSDEKYLYYLPGAHGTAGFSGTPVIQYNIRKGTQKVLAFLSQPMTEAWLYEPGGTYGMKLSKDGSKLYVGLNGSPPEPLRPEELHQGFGLTSFAIIEIPAEERDGG